MGLIQSLLRKQSLLRLRDDDSNLPSGTAAHFKPRMMSSYAEDGPDRSFIGQRGTTTHCGSVTWFVLIICSLDDYSFTVFFIYFLLMFQFAFAEHAHKSFNFS